MKNCAEWRRRTKPFAIEEFDSNVHLIVTADGEMDDLRVSASAIAIHRQLKLFQLLLIFFVSRNTYISILALSLLPSLRPSQ